MYDTPEEAVAATHAEWEREQREARLQKHRVMWDAVLPTHGSAEDVVEVTGKYADAQIEAGRTVLAIVHEPVALSRVVVEDASFPDAWAAHRFVESVLRKEPGTGHPFLRTSTLTGAPVSRIMYLAPGVEAPDLSVTIQFDECDGGASCGANETAQET